MGEILGLAWSDVDLAKGQITVRASKNGEMRHLPITAPLREILERIPRQIANPYVFAQSDGAAPVDFRKTWDATVAPSGVKNFVFDDLRHTFASYFVMATGDLYVLKDLMGHKTPAMAMRYAHLAPSYKKGLMKKMAQKVAAGTLQMENATQMPRAQTQTM